MHPLLGGTVEEAGQPYRHGVVFLGADERTEEFQSRPEVWVTATTPQEAIAAEAAGADVLVAQGSEAGGHRGTWSNDDPFGYNAPNPSFTGEFDLMRNGANSSYQALQAQFRHRLAHGLQTLFSYTWAHSIDLGSAAESGAGKQGAAIQNIFNTKEFRGSSDFDIRHNISANFLYELPLGKNKRFFGNVPGWANYVIGGWQVSSVIRYRSGLPTAVIGDLAYNANYWLSSLAIVTAPVSAGWYSPTPLPIRPPPSSRPAPVVWAKGISTALSRSAAAARSTPPRR